MLDSFVQRKKIYDYKLQEKYFRFSNSISLYFLQWTAAMEAVSLNVGTLYLLSPE